jgi:EAL domain-containing protein (putative c-di-GMP-specific phosphodiesterase class I)
VNLSPRQLQAPGLASEVAAVLEETGLPPEGLGLEITESVLMEYGAAAAIAALGELKALGVRLALDDFGTGYSSLAYLKRLPVDLLKIDRSFVAGLGRGAEDEALVEAMINLGRAFGLRVLAEGVETEEQFERVRSLGCDLAQGYHLARPLPEPEATRFLEERL